MSTLPIGPLLIAAFGGFCLNMMNLYEDSQRPRSERVDKDSLYWIFFIFWPILGAGLTWVYIISGYNIDGVLALTTGLSGPTILQTLMSKTVVPSINDENSKKIGKIEE